MSDHFRQRTSLFYRIVIRLCLPLVFLGLGFMTIQLSNKIGVLNELHHLRSRAAIDAMKDFLHINSAQLINSATTKKLEAQLEQLADIHSVEDIYLYDILERKSLLSASFYEWTDVDFRAAEKSLGLLQKGKSYYITINKGAKKLMAYIPIQIVGDHVIVSRLIFSLANVKEALSGSFKTLIVIILFVIITGLAIAYGLAKSIINPIRQINRATEEIMNGELNAKVKINTGDEIEALSHAFNHMSSRLKDIKKSAEDSNPLTKLPGNQSIYQETQNRIYERQKFVFFHVDIDRFKLFNDFFGLAAGDKAIQGTADILKKAVKEKGSGNDFIGHQGGDDFVVIVRADHAKAVGELACKLFDKEVTGSLYPKEDLERGFTIQEDRRGMQEGASNEKKMREFPLMAISLAGISNAKKEIPDYFHVMSAATHMKKKAKANTASCYLIDDEM